MSFKEIPLTRLSTREAATYLGLSASTLKTSRVTGRLAGVKPPRFRKLGRRVVYELAELDAWLKQFEQKANTAV